MNGEKAEPFRNLGLDQHEIKSKIVHFVSFDISEDDPRWPHVAQLVKKVRAGDFTRTEFTEAELEGAKFLVMHPSWHHDYPQPEDDFGYMNATYDLSSYCDECGAGAKQVAPFRMTKPPSWGQKSILQLNWVFDEYFVKPDVWERVFEPLGIKYRPVVQNRTGRIIESVVQLDISTQVEVQMAGHAFSQCSSCGAKLYATRIDGYFPPPLPTAAPLFKSLQYFGSGARARHEVFISQDLYRKMHSEDVRGAEFQACRPLEN